MYDGSESAEVDFTVLKCFTVHTCSFGRCPDSIQSDISVRNRVDQPSALVFNLFVRFLYVYSYAQKQRDREESRREGL
jgi:hypothetical protein